MAHNGIMPQTITLSTGKTYTPEKGQPPVSPCLSCREKDFSKWGACNSGFGVCADYMDFEYMNATYKKTVF